jgi:hypothetical protein
MPIMRSRIRIAVVLFLVSAICAGGLSLMAKPFTGHKWQHCPRPACTEPCDPDEFPNILCKRNAKDIRETSWACCCCGEQGKFNKYRGLY